MTVIADGDVPITFGQKTCRGGSSIQRFITAEGLWLNALINKLVDAPLNGSFPWCFLIEMENLGDAELIETENRLTSVWHITGWGLEHSTAPTAGSHIGCMTTPSCSRQSWGRILVTCCLKLKIMHHLHCFYFILSFKNLLLSLLPYLLPPSLCFYACFLYAMFSLHVLWKCLYFPFSCITHPSYNTLMCLSLCCIAIK